MRTKCCLESIVCLLLLLSLGACRPKPTYVVPSPEQGVDEQELLIQVQKQLIQVETEQIQKFIKRHQWQMDQSHTGIYYDIYDLQPGPKPSHGDTVVLAYTICSIAGDTIYHSERDGLKMFIIGRNQEARGLDEGVRMISKGSKGRLILPSNHAYGLTGDGQRIPRMSVLVCHIELRDMHPSVNQ